MAKANLSAGKKLGDLHHLSSKPVYIRGAPWRFYLFQMGEELYVGVTVGKLSADGVLENVVGSHVWNARYIAIVHFHTTDGPTPLTMPLRNMATNFLIHSSGSFQCFRFSAAELFRETGVSDGNRITRLSVEIDASPEPYTIM